MTLHITPKRFKKMRAELGMTQAAIARIFGYPDAQMIGRYERSETAIPGYVKVLMHLIHDEQVNGNKRAVRDYVGAITTSQRAGEKP